MEINNISGKIVIKMSCMHLKTEDLLLIHQGSSVNADHMLTCFILGHYKVAR